MPDGHPGGAPARARDRRCRLPAGASLLQIPKELRFISELGIDRGEEPSGGRSPPVVVLGGGDAKPPTDELGGGNPVLPRARKGAEILWIEANRGGTFGRHTCDIHQSASSSKCGSVRGRVGVTVHGPCFGVPALTGLGTCLTDVPRGKRAFSEGQKGTENPVSVVRFRPWAPLPR